MKKPIVICAGLVVFAAALAAQGGGAASPDGTTQALVTELRALRTDITRIVGASIRTQLLVGRLQLQEQRILTLSRQVADVQKEIANAAQARIGMETQLKRMESAQNVRVEEREEIENVIRGLQPQVAQQLRREQELRQQESSLSALVAEEQARWTDFSSRLDELERTLTVPHDRD